MKEIVLRHFFEGHATAAELASDLEGTRVVEELPGFKSSANYRILPMTMPFAVLPEHVVRIIDGVLGGELPLSALDVLVFCIEAAPGRWLWDTDMPDGERVSEAFFWLGTPEANYPLTPAVLRKIRFYLLTGENTLSKSDLMQRVDGGTDV